MFGFGNAPPPHTVTSPHSESRVARAAEIRRSATEHTDQHTPSVRFARLRRLLHRS